jgi:hypothetical protein
MNVPQFTPEIFTGEQKNKKGDSLTDEIEQRRIEKKRRRYD